MHTWGGPATSVRALSRREWQGLTIKPLLPHACLRSRAWPAEPARRWRLASCWPVRCSSPAPLSQRLAGLLEDLLLLTPRARRGLNVHRTFVV